MLFYLCVGLKSSITKGFQYEIEKGGSRRYLSKCGFSVQLWKAFHYRAQQLQI